MYRGVALLAALLAVSGCGIDPVSPKETRVDYAGFVTSADQAAIYANAQCATINRLAVFKAEDVADGRKGATFQCLPVPKCYPQEAAAPGQPVALTPAMPVAAGIATRPGQPYVSGQSYVSGQPYVPGQHYVVPPSASARLPGPIVAMAPISSARDRRAGRKSGQASIDDQAYDADIPFAARPVAAGPQPQPIPSFEAINIPTGPDPVSAEAPAPQPGGSFATTAASSWQQAVSCKPNATLPLTVNHLPTGNAYPF